MPSIHEQLRYIYGDLDADYNRSALMRHAVDMEGALGDIGERVERSVKSEEANRVKIGIAMKAGQVQLQRSIIESRDKLTSVHIKAWVDRSNNINTNHQRMITGLAAKAQKSIERAMSASKTNIGQDSEAIRKAAWESVLGTLTPTGSEVSATDPSAPFVLRTMNANWGEFIPEHHSEQVQHNYNRLQEAAELQNTSITAYTNGLDEQQAELTSALAFMEEGNTVLAQERLDAVASKAGRLADSAITYATDEATQAKMVAEQLAEDPEYQALREKTDKLWGQLLEDPAGQRRKAYAGLLSKEGFQQWAKSNGLVVGNAEVDANGEVLSFSPGKDLMMAYDIAQKQRAKRPTAGDAGPLIARKGERDLVRIVQNDGKVILGRKLPMQATDEAGSHRISTTGGEVYIPPSQVKKVDVVKEKVRFDLKTPIKAAAGSMSEARARTAYEALARKGEVEPDVAELPDKLPDKPSGLEMYKSAQQKLAAEGDVSAAAQVAAIEAAELAPVPKAPPKAPPKVATPPPPQPPNDSDLDEMLSASPAVPKIVTFPEVSKKQKRKNRRASRLRTRADKLQVPPKAEGTDVPTRGLFPKLRAKRQAARRGR